MYFKVS